MFSNEVFFLKNRYAAEGGPVCLKIPEPNSCPSPPLGRSHAAPNDNYDLYVLMFGF
jgi:hypothetical protein